MQIKEKPGEAPRGLLWKKLQQEAKDDPLAAKQLEAMEHVSNIVRLSKGLRNLDSGLPQEWCKVSQ